MPVSSGVKVILAMPLSYNIMAMTSLTIFFLLYLVGSDAVLSVLFTDSGLN